MEVLQEPETSLVEGRQTPVVELAVENLAGAEEEEAAEVTLGETTTGTRIKIKLHPLPLRHRANSLPRGARGALVARRTMTTMTTVAVMTMTPSIGVIVSRLTNVTHVGRTFLTASVTGPLSQGKRQKPLHSRNSPK